MAILALTQADPTQVSRCDFTSFFLVWKETKLNTHNTL